MAIILVCLTIFMIIYPFPSKEAVAYFHSDHPIIYQQQVYENEVVRMEDINYVSLSFIQEKIDPFVTFDEKSQSVIITTKDKVVQLSGEELRGFINDKPFHFEVPVLVTDDNKRFINLEQLTNIYPLSIEYVAETGVLFLRNHGEELQLAQIIGKPNEHDSKLREDASKASPFTASVTEGEKVYVENSSEDYFFVRKENGLAGYIAKKYVSLGDKLQLDLAVEEIELPVRQEVEKPIHLTWEAVYSKNPNTAALPEMPGLNVVSPTWFKIKNEQGDVSNLGSMEYMNWAKGKELQVWALFSNNFDPDLTHEVLKDFETRQTIIRQILQYSEMYQLDGINVDFENVYLQDKDRVTQFMRELTPFLHQAGLTVSMDITFISNSEMWSMFYDRAALTEIVDYMIVMAYDEHWGSSPLAGSVASLPWVEKNVVKLLEIIPAEKLILGVPLYTRIWTEQDTPGGNVEVSSKALSMDQVKQWLEEHQLTPSYDEPSGQNYAELRDDLEGATYKIWIEDELSLTSRTELVHRYQLAGVASWARNFANDNGWEALDKGLKNKNIEK